MSAMKRLFAVTIAVIGMVIAAASLGLSAYGYGGTAPQIAVSNTTPPQGSSLTVTGSHFTPNATADLSLHSTPVSLGSVHTDANGNFAAQVTIPSSTTVGTHTIEALDTPTGDIASATISVTGSGGGGGGGGGGLAGTGVAVIGIGALGVVLLIGGGLMLMAGRRRKVAA